MLQSWTRHRRSALSVDDAVGTTTSGAAGGWTSAAAGDVSPGGTLTRGGSAGDTLRSQRSNARAPSKLQSLFSLVKVMTDS